MKSKSRKNKFLSILLGATIASCPLSMALNPVLTVEAHRGHHGNYASSCYYHCGGHPAHLHENGVCPYAGSSVPSVPSAAQQQAAQAATTTTSHACGWHHDHTGWWYSESNGQYMKGGKCMIDGNCFLFDDNGYMQTGWHETEHCWNYYDENGYMACGWKEIGGKWYYFDSLGSMMIGVQHIDDELYCFDEDGAWDGNYYDDNFNVIVK